MTDDEREYKEWLRSVAGPDDDDRESGKLPAGFAEFARQLYQARGPISPEEFE